MKPRIQRAKIGICSLYLPLSVARKPSAEVIQVLTSVRYPLTRVMTQNRCFEIGYIIPA